MWRIWIQGSKILGFIPRLSDEIKDGDTGPKISSVSGANRKRKWKEDEEEEEQKAEESSDLDTSSDEEEEKDEETNETTEMIESKETISPCLEDKQEVKGEQNKTEQDGQNEKKISDPEKIQNKTPSEPAVFVPVDRSPEIQVCVCVCETTYYIHIGVFFELAFILQIYLCRRLV